MRYSPDLIDFLAGEHRSLALVGPECLQLGPIATTIMLNLPCSRDDLIVLLGREHGAPPDLPLDEAVDQQVQLLVDAGVIEVDDQPLNSP